MSKPDARDTTAPYDDLFLRSVVASGLVSSTQLQLVGDIHEGLAESGIDIPIGVILLRRSYITLSQANQILKATPDRLIYCERCQAYRLVSKSELGIEATACESCGVELPISPADLLALDDESGIAEPVPAAPDDLIGEEVQGYVIDAWIDEGHYRSWYHATDPRSGKEIVLCEVPSRIRRNREQFRQLNEDFHRVKLVNDPGKPDSFDLVQVRNRPYVMQAPIPGRSLESIVEQRGAIRLDAVIKLMTPVAELSVAGHRLDLIDIDPNPAMIIIDEYMRPRLMDVSTGFMHSDDISQLRYRAPERIAHQTVNEPADIYSFCAVCYFMLTGAPPFPGDDVMQVGKAILEGRYRPIKDVLPDLDRPMVELITKGLALSPSNRQQDFKEILDNLRLQSETKRSAAATVVPSSRQTPRVQPSSPPARGERPPSSKGGSVGAASKDTARKFPPGHLIPSASSTVRIDRLSTAVTGTGAAGPEDRDLTPEEVESQRVREGLQLIAEYGNRAREFMKLKRYKLAIKALSRILEYEGKGPEFDVEVANARKAIGLLEQQKERG